MKQHSINFFRYCLIGGSCTILDWSFFAVFAIGLGFNYLLVGGLGFVALCALNYVLCIKFLYKSGACFSDREEVVAVYLVSIIGLVFHEFILLATHEWLLLPLMLCKMLATAVVLFWNFGARNFYIFAERRE